MMPPIHPPPSGAAGGKAGGVMARLIQASAHDLPMIPSGSVHCIATSPPYWHLRGYAGVQAVAWDAVTYVPIFGLPPVTIPAITCELGMEATLEAYIGHLLLCLREWWRVLRDDGCCWVNLGDTYANDTKWGGRSSGKNCRSLAGGYQAARNTPARTGLPGKNLCMIPARFALAAQADGWFLRSEVVWHKPNGLPDSAEDRLGRAHEIIYLLTKRARGYYYDGDAIRTPLAAKTLTTTGTQRKGNGDGTGMVKGQNFTQTNARQHLADEEGNLLGANRRSVWRIAPGKAPNTHFATWPEKLVEPMILAGTSAYGCCPVCGAPWKRQRERTGHVGRREPAHMPNNCATKMDSTGWAPATRPTNNWQPTCTCPPAVPAPCVVLDPFNGSGTTGRVALRLGRRYIGVDLSAEYLDQLTPPRLTVQPELGGVLP